MQKTSNKTSNGRCCYISALQLTSFRLTKGRATFFRPETIVASFLHLMVLFFKVIFNYTSKRQFVVLHFLRTTLVILFIIRKTFFKAKSHPLLYLFKYNAFSTTILTQNHFLTTHFFCYCSIVSI